MCNILLQNLGKLYSLLSEAVKQVSKLILALNKHC